MNYPSGTGFSAANESGTQPSNYYPTPSQQDSRGNSQASSFDGLVSRARSAAAAAASLSPSVRPSIEFPTLPHTGQTNDSGNSNPTPPSSVPRSNSQLGSQGPLSLRTISHVSPSDGRSTSSVGTRGGPYRVERSRRTASSTTRGPQGSGPHRSIHGRNTLSHGGTSASSSQARSSDSITSASLFPSPPPSRPTPPSLPSDEDDNATSPASTAPTPHLAQQPPSQPQGPLVSAQDSCPPPAALHPYPDPPFHARLGALQLGEPARQVTSSLSSDHEDLPAARFTLPDVGIAVPPVPLLPPPSRFYASPVGTRNRPSVLHYGEVQMIRDRLCWGWSFDEVRDILLPVHRDIDVMIELGLWEDRNQELIWWRYQRETSRGLPGAMFMDQELRSRVHSV